MINENIFSTFPILYSERLLYRSYEITDAKRHLAYRKDKNASKYMDSKPPEKIEDSEQKILEFQNSFDKKKGITWAIVDKSSKQLIGDFAIWKIDKENARGEIGYILDPNFWGKGYMSEAMDTIIRFGFNRLNLHSYVASVNPENKNSSALLLKYGFKLEANFRENFYYDGKFLNSEIYCLLESDIKKL